MKKRGVSVDYVMNVFPTKTLPNHQSIATGFYPENHGIIDNDFLNPDNGRIFHGQPDSEWWNKTTPIWTQNQIAGSKSGVIYWPGYRVRYANRTPNFTPIETPAATTTTEALRYRIKLAINWLKHDDVTFVAVYTSNIDEVGHEYGTNKSNIVAMEKYKQTLRKTDDMFGDLEKQLQMENLTDTVNVIAIGDHGMTTTSHQRVIHLDDFIDSRNDLKYVFGFTTMYLYTRYNSTEHVYKTLYGASKKKNSHFKVFLKKDIPCEFHIKNNSFTAPILIIPDLGWVILCKAQKIPYHVGEWERGEHGYSNKERAMNPGFFAVGPMFKKNFQQRSFEIVDLYSLMCYMLGLPMNSRDGKFKRVKTLLKDFP